MKLQKLFAAAAGLVLAGASAFAQSKPTVAVLYFTNSVLGAKANEDYAPLSKGMADMLPTEATVSASLAELEKRHCIFEMPGRIHKVIFNLKPAVISHQKSPRRHG